MRRQRQAAPTCAHARGARRAVVALMAPLLLSALAACEGTLPVMDHDRYGELTRDDFREALEPRPVPSSTPADAAGPAIPELQPLVELPPPLSPAERKLVSLSVNETVPLKDVLIELGRRAEVDLELDPQIAGGVILTMRERPLREVIERIADLAGLRFAFQGSSLRIERDLPYYANYRVDYLHLTRQANSVVETSVNIMGGDQGTDGNASSSAISGQSDANFWHELEHGLRQILSNSQPRERLVIPAAAPPAPAPPAGTGGEPGDEAAIDQAYEAALQPPAPPVIVESAPEAPFTTNRQAGVVSVFATRRQHELVAAYLAELRESISRQVLIEAKILEVALADEFNSGINWRAVLDNLSIAAPLGTSVAAPPFNTPFDATPDVVTVALDRGDLDVIANFIQRFGTVRTLSSPRITVLQNQTAVLKVAENQVFFRLFFERVEEEDGDDQINISSEIRTVPIGLIVTVQPSINRETEEISMALRPTVTRVVDVVDDPAVAIASNNTVVSQIPVVAVQEIDSVVTMRSGQVVVMGGLMHDLSSNRDEGVPALGQLPGLGYLFKAREEETRQTELVMFLRATIVDDGGIDPFDADLYRRFGRDRRPFAMPGGSP